MGRRGSNLFDGPVGLRSGPVQVPRGLAPLTRLDLALMLLLLAVVLLLLLLLLLLALLVLLVLRLFAVRLL